MGEDKRGLTYVMVLLRLEPQGAELLTFWGASAQADVSQQRNAGLGSKHTEP
ncbi:hypothetical protein H6F76_18675 [Leptolyngbya sp. FACHB-321]|uniref:hypothetical protein n=1 Tax=Leptolyngbya sp. FACHB-321 TaxID=2692807 RepID=UPI001686261E|nr:hypothetical protein [Leptolyngbya sp. FACHB-321]MBD2037006.1 hypothetical protein [Leptolyngbya sp. FACHB-321]